MHITVVINPKGGSGKSTLITNLAGFYASRGKLVVLQDDDPQQSSSYWLQSRPAALPVIYQLRDFKKNKQQLVPHHLLVDTAAGVHGQAIKEYIKEADQIVVPIQSSGFDINASKIFLQHIRELKQIRKEKTRVALIGMRISPRTRSAADLEQFLADEGFPVLGYVPESQIYVQLAQSGYSLFDLPPAKQKKELPLWQSITQWLDYAE